MQLSNFYDVLGKNTRRECKLLTRQCGFKLLLNIPYCVTKENTCMQYIYT